MHIDIHFYCLTYEGGKTKWKKTQIKMLRKTHRKIWTEQNLHRNTVLTQAKEQTKQIKQKKIVTKVVAAEVAATNITMNIIK